MKKILTAVLAAMLVLSLMVPALAEVQIGQTLYAAHGTKCFSLMTVAVDGNVIVDAYIDEFQIMDSTLTTPVPNAESMFGDKLGENQQLGSKRVNNEYYSELLASHAAATNTLAASYDAIQEFVTGKTIAELEALLAGTEAAAMVDTVAGSTLADTYGYIAGLVEAAKTVK